MSEPQKYEPQDLDALELSRMGARITQTRDADGTTRLYATFKNQLLLYRHKRRDGRVLEEFVNFSAEHINLMASGDF